MSSQIDEALIKKQILHPGRKFVNFTNGTRVNTAKQLTKKNIDSKCLSKHTGSIPLHDP